MTFYIFAYISELPVDFTVGIPKHGDSLFAQICIAFLVFGLSIFLVMLGAVYLYGDFRTGAVKVENVLAEYFLAVYGDGQFFQTVIPQLAFFFCHVVSQVLCISC